MSGFNYSRFVDITSKIQKPTFTVEKKHGLLAIDNPLFPSTIPFIEFTSLLDYKAMFGANDSNLTFVQKYFNFISKTGTTVDKLVVARWYNNATAGFLAGNDVSKNLAILKAITNGSFKISLNSSENEIVCDFSTQTSLSGIATVIQTALQTFTDDEAFTTATCQYNTTINGFIITNGTTGVMSTVDSVGAGTTGTNLLNLLGFASNPVLSQGANVETYADYCDRLYQANNSGFAYTTNITIEDDDITNSIAWVQAYNNSVKLVFSFNDYDNESTFISGLLALNYTSYVFLFDPYNEYVNALDCAIGGSIDYTNNQGTINFNFQPAIGYTPITTYGTVQDYQNGKTNEVFGNQLDALKVNYIYSVGFGNQQTTLYGTGAMVGAYGLESTQINEAWFVKSLQTAVMNAFISLNKIQLQGEDGKNTISSVIQPSFNQAKINGTLSPGTLTATDKINIVAITGNPQAPDSITNNGYYYQIQSLTDEDIQLKRVRILILYLTGGVVNKIQAINNLFGA